MSNGLQSDLLYAILSMDSYNRGYGAGVAGLNESGQNANIGHFAIVQNISQSNWEATGFYALAYELVDAQGNPTGQRVISYRGTDNLNPLSAANDIENGWLVGGGAQWGQAPLSIAFYKAVVGADDEGYFTSNPFTNNITLTGHSLGGGLAGYVASLYGKSAEIFDNMPFEIASNVTQARARLNETTGFGSIKQAVYGQYDVADIDRSKIGGSFTENEILQALRHLQATEVDSVESYADFSALNLHARALKLHMMDLLVNLMWAEDNNKVDWQSAGPQLWTAYFDDDVAKAITGIDDRKGTAGYAGVMGRMIAYSALGEGKENEGEKPFGDTAIWSMFNDADELGRVLAGAEADFFDAHVRFDVDIGIGGVQITKDVKQWLADVLVQYAGALALYDVEQADGGKIATPYGLVDARQGILSRKEDDSALAVDLSRVLWGDVLKSNATAVTKLDGERLAPVDMEAFRQAYFKQAEENGLFSVLKRFMGLQGKEWSDGDLLELAKDVWKADTLDIFDRFHLAPTDDATSITLDGRNYSPSVALGNLAQVDVYIGSEANETIIDKTQGHSLIVTGEGTDIVNAGRGNDVVVSSGGGDHLDGGEGNDWLIAKNGSNAMTAGGLGRDYIYNQTVGGVVWGDVENSVRLADGRHAYYVSGVQYIIEDSAENADRILYAPDITVMDAQHHDILTFYGMPLTGGDAAASAVALGVGIAAGAATRSPQIGLQVAAGAAGAANLAAAATGNQVYFDHLLPFITYKKERNSEGGYDLIIGNVFDDFWTAITGGPSGLFSTDPDDGTDITGTMRIKNFDFVSSEWGYEQFDLAEKGTMNMVFKDANWKLGRAQLLAALPPIAGSGALGIAAQIAAILDPILSMAAAMARASKAIGWIDGVDPLIIDLDGDGIETIGLSESQVVFDVDGDMFREATGWLKGDDGFLVLDDNHNGRIDDISEMFGNRFEGGYAELAAYDSNGDGAINAQDLIWSELQIWQDYDRDGVTDAGELKSLDALGIVSLSLSSLALDATTPQGTRLLSYGNVAFESGRISTMFEAIFNSSDTVTRYAGEAGRAPWQDASTLNAKGFGNIADLAVAAANDVGFAQLTQSTAAAMTAPNLRTLVAQAGDVLGAWGMTLETSRELIAVQLGSDGALLDHKPWDGGALEAGWRLEQGWSPSDRGAAEMPARDEAPYLVHVVNGRAVILDYGIKQSDGTWKLASNAAVTYANVADIVALSHAAGTEWRVEDIQANPLANLSVEKMGVYFINGEVKDYTVRVTDNIGSFYVWARNLDRALQLQAKGGSAAGFNLRNFEVNLATLDEVNSTDDSTFRVELLTPAQFHFATSMGGIDFRPEMLTANYNNVTGQLTYSVNGVRGAGRYVAEVDADGRPVMVTYSDGTTAPSMVYESDVKTMIAMLQPVMEQYIVTSRRFAVRMAIQGGLKDYARGLSYDAARDVYAPTTNRQLAPMFEAIFEGAPTSNADDATLDYLTGWNEILWQVYPDYAPTGAGNLFGGSVGVDQAFIMQMLIPAFEARGWTFDPATGEGTGLDIRGVAHALSVNEERIITHAANALTVGGTSGTDYFYMTSGDQTLVGGNGADFYFAGKNGGNDVIRDQDTGGDDELRFTAVDSAHVKAVRDGQDLILHVLNDAGDTVNTVRLADQFLGELNPYLSSGKQMESGVNQIVFSDGVIWDRFRIAMQVADPRDTVDEYVGSGSGDVLWGGKGNDLLKGGLGGDIYVFQRGDGHDVIEEDGGFSFGPLKAGLDFLTFRGDITAEDLVLRRDGEGTTLYITILDKQGNPTGDAIDIVDYFGGISLGLGLYGRSYGKQRGAGLCLAEPRRALHLRRRHQPRIHAGRRARPRERQDRG